MQMMGRNCRGERELSWGYWGLKGRLPLGARKGEVQTKKPKRKKDDELGVPAARGRKKNGRTRRKGPGRESIKMTKRTRCARSASWQRRRSEKKVSEEKRGCTGKKLGEA